MAKVSESQKAPTVPVDVVQQRTCILVMGMHRSGTSALTRMISLLGATLPATLMGGTAEHDSSNQQGHWESAPIAQLNDAILNSVGSSWRKPDSLPADWLNSQDCQGFKKQALRLIDTEFGLSSLFVLKDPRICKLAPFWIAVLGDADIRPVVASIVRSPAEVAESLGKRNELDTSLGKLLWLRYVLDAERDTRSVNRSHIAYSYLLADWRGVATQLSQDLGLDWSRDLNEAERDVSTFIQPTLRHHIVDPVTLGQGGLNGWVAATYECLLEWSRSGENPAGRIRLDNIKSEFDQLSHLFEKQIEIAFDQSTSLFKLRRIRSRLEKEAIEASARVESLAREFDGREIAIAELNTINEIATRDNQQFIARVADLEARVKLIASNYTKERRERLAVVRKLMIVSDKLTKTIGERDTAKASSLDSSARAEQERERAAATLDQLAKTSERLIALAEELQSVIRERDDRTSQVARLQTTNTALQGDLDARKRQLSKLRELSALREQENAQNVAKSISAAQTALSLATERQEMIEHLRRDRSAKVAQRDQRLAKMNDRLKQLERQQSADAAEIMALRRRLVPLHRKFFDTVLSIGRSKFRGATIVRENENITLLHESGLFDAAFYLEIYPDVRLAGLDPLRHYLKFGGSEGRSPCAEFNGKWYLWNNPDVASLGVNPLLHYIEHGQQEGREIRPYRRPAITASPENFASRKSPAKPVSQTGEKRMAVPTRWVASKASFARLVDVKPQVDVGPLKAGANSVAFGGCIIAENAPHDTVQSNPALAWFKRLTTANSPVPLSSVEDAFSLILSNGRLTFRDIWFGNGQSLRVRCELSGQGGGLVLRCYQHCENGRLNPCGSGVLLTDGVIVAQFPLSNTFQPILLVVNDIDGNLSDVAILPFPSLCRGALHYAELEFLHPHEEAMSAVRSYSVRLLSQIATDQAEFALARIVIDLRMATGNEAIFSPSLLTWLSRNLGLVLEPLVSDGIIDGNAHIPEEIFSFAGRERPSPDREGGGVLVLTPDSVPTLGALFTHRNRDDHAAGTTTLFVNYHDGHEALTVPTSDDELAVAWRDFKVAKFAKPHLLKGQAATELLALRMPQIREPDIRELFPIPADIEHPLVSGSEATNVTIVIRCHNSDASLKLLLQSLGRQQYVGAVEVVLIGDFAEVSVAEMPFFGGGISFGISKASAGLDFRSTLLAIAQAAQYDFLMLLDDAMVLSDDRSLSVLSGICGLENCGTATAVTIQERKDAKGRTTFHRFAGTIRSIDSSRKVDFANYDVGSMALPWLFSVAFNPLHCMMVRRDRFISVLSTKSSDCPDSERELELELGIGMAKAGLSNLVTSTLAVGDSLGDRATVSRCDLVNSEMLGGIRITRKS